MSPEEINEYLLGKFKGKRSPDERELSEFSKQIYRKLDFQPMWVLGAKPNPGRARGH